MNLPNKFACGLDEVPIKILKCAAESICKPLSDIMNEAISEGVFPSELKKGKIIPIYKKGDPSNVENYRPISLLSSFSKIFERVLYDRIFAFLRLHGLLSDHQYGFVPLRSTELAIYTAVDRIVELVDANQRVAGLYFDLSKAFDMINHRLLLDRLSSFGLRGACQSLMESYLRGRKQVICITNDGKSYFSEPRGGERGVPQGSILGPLMFILYVNGLSGDLSGGHVCQYADDTSVILSGASVADLSGACSGMVSEMKNWCMTNSLKLNTDKTGVMQFSKTKTNESLHIRGETRTIPMADSFKFLGVHLDPLLNWNQHCRMLISRLSSNCALIRRLRDNLLTETIKLYYVSCIQSILNYGILFWGSSREASGVFRAQKRIIRCVFGLSPRTGCRPYFLKLGVLTAPSLYFLALVMFVKRKPELFKRNDQQYADAMSMITRGRGDLCIPSHNSAFFERGPHLRAIKAYRSLPEGIRVKGSVRVFREEAIKYLQGRCFYEFNNW